MRRPTRVSSVALALAIAAGGILTSVPAPAAAADTVTLRMYATSHEVTMRASRNGSVSLDLGAWIAAPDRAFEIHTERAGYDAPIVARQVFADGSSRVIPRHLIRGFRGFRDFFRLQVVQGGDVVAARQVDWCPGGYELERINDDGPFDPRYPQGCYANPFTLGLVSGIDRGWAVPALRRERLRLAPGRYRFRVTIAPAFRDLFAIAYGDASITVYGTVKARSSRTVPPAPAPDARLAPIPTMTDPPTGSVPDLVALPAFSVGVRNGRSKDLVTFAANVWNRGPAPLVVEGFRRSGTMKMDAYQYFSVDGRFIGRAPVGGFHFDRRHGHHHWHFLQFARYRLLGADGEGVVRSHKQSFCLAPTDAIDMTVRGATWRPEEIGFTRCGDDGSIWIREVLPTGWGDTYYQGVSGQAFDISDVPNGRYYIEVRANPTGLLYDRTAGNDVRLREIVLRGRPGHRRIVVPPWHGIRA